MNVYRRPQAAANTHPRSKVPAMGPTSDEVQALLYAFAMRCFVGAVPSCSPSPIDLECVRTALETSASLTPAEVAQWSIAWQWALYSILVDAISALELAAPFRFPDGELDGSSAECLAQPLLTGLASVPGAIRG